MPRPLPVDPPPQIADLTRDARGYPVPAEVGWTNGKPLLAGMEPLHTTALAFRRACVVCGLVLADGQPVWRNFSQKMAAHARVEGRDFSVDPAFAGHLSCMIFSVFACPYWASTHGKLGKDSLVAPGALRGTRPAVLGFADVYYLAGEGPGEEPRITEEPLIGYATLLGDLQFHEPNDLHDQYEAALQADSRIIDSSSRRSYWPNTNDDQELISIITAARAAMRQSEPTQFISVDGEHRMAFRLPLA